MSEESYIKTSEEVIEEREAEVVRGNICEMCDAELPVGTQALEKHRAKIMKSNDWGKTWTLKRDRPRYICAKCLGFMEENGHRETVVELLESDLPATHNIWAWVPKRQED